VHVTNDPSLESVTHVNRSILLFSLADEERPSAQRSLIDIHDLHICIAPYVGVHEHEYFDYESSTQDFVMIDNPVFFVRNVEDYIPLMQDFRALAIGGTVSKLLAGIKLLLMPVQTLESAEQMKVCENLSFLPWHTLETLRPLGGINRARRAASGIQKSML